MLRKSSGISHYFVNALYQYSLNTGKSQKFEMSSWGVCNILACQCIQIFRKKNKIDNINNHSRTRIRHTNLFPNEAKCTKIILLISTSENHRWLSPRPELLFVIFFHLIPCLLSVIYMVSFKCWRWLKMCSFQNVTEIF